MKRLSILLVWVIVFFLDLAVFAQNQTYTICPNGFVRIKASDGSFGYRWDPNPTLSNLTVQDPIAAPVTTTTYTVRSKVTDGNNLVTNGDFENGNVGFTSEYTYYKQGTLTGQLEQGLYSVTSQGERANKYNIGFGNFGDHSGTGRMLIADGACGTNGVPVRATVWKQTIAVAPNTDYIFSAWMTNVALAGVSSSLRFSINGEVIGTPSSTLNQVGVWGQFYVTWNSGSATTAEIAIAEQTGVCGGNDFAIDDISFNKVKDIVETVQVIVGPPTTTPVITGDNSLCLSSTINLNSSISGGKWASSNPSVATIDVNTGKITPVSLGKTNITYTVGGSCGNAISLPFEVTVIALPTIPVITGNNSLCLSSSINLTGSVAGGVWTSSNLSVATIDATGKITPVSSGKTNITYSISGGCGSATSLPFEITVNGLPEVPVITGNNSLCLSGTINLNSSATDGTWISSALSVAIIDALGKITPVSAGKTNITYVLNSSCGSITSLPFEVTVNSLPQLDKITGTANLNIGQQSPLTINMPGGTWASTDGTVVEIASDGTAKGLKSGESEITYTLNTPCGILVSLPFKITVLSDDLYFPNAFTPNSDGNNDEFKIYGSSIDKIEFSIFNQWGELVYKTTDPSKGWTGTYKEVAQPAGVYIYTAKITMIDGHEITKKGAVSLIR